jgi:ABC-2 type transport system ATP-binding protein
VKRTALLAVLALSAPVLAVTAHAAAPAYTVKALTLTVQVPQEGVAGPTSCVIDADLYTPRGVDRSHPAPAVLMTNGFGGSKADQADGAKTLASRGYVALSYSGLGFGGSAQSGARGSDCKITLDDREHDGTAGSQLVDFLGGIKAADDGTRVDYVVKDRVAHDGKVHAGDVRIGMVGGSYGGQIQFAIAGVDPRMDTIVPIITWNDLAYSLAPNNTSLVPGTTSYTVPGTEKLDWVTAFFALGVADGVQNTFTGRNTTHLGACPNFSDEACRIKLSMDATGYADDASIAFARHASVATYLDKIRIPTMLWQGQGDTLFTLREAAATYAALKARHVPVKMMWQSWGHSNSASRPHEFDLKNPTDTLQGKVLLQWFDHFLKGRGARPAMDFSYYQDWKDKGDARAAYRTVPSYPLPGTTTLYASGTDLVRSAKGLLAGSTTIGAPAAPLSYSETSVFQTTAPLSSIEPQDAPGTTALLTTGALTRDVDVVGTPSATLQLASPTASGVSPSSMLVAFVKLYDVAPDGTRSLPWRLVSPIRVADLSKPVQVALPGIVHRFAKGHRMELAIALTDWAYKGNTLAQVATLSTSQAAPTTLTLPGKLPLAAFPR